MHKSLLGIVIFILRRCGKLYTPDPALPAGYMLKTAVRRAVWLLRGLIRLRGFVFIGRHVTIDGHHNLQIGRYVTIDPDVWINAVARQKMVIGHAVRIGAYSRVMCTAHLSKVGRGFAIGDHSSCGEFCFFGAAGGITIGRNVIMGQYVSLHAQDHVFGDTFIPIQHQATTERGIVIGDDCWIGAKVTILDGAVIGKGCVIAAGAVVKGEFPEFAVIGGVPAKIIRLRHA